MYLVIDNYDSYVYNLIAYLRYQKEGQEEVVPVRECELDFFWLKEQIEKKKIKGVVISPGPKHPRDYSYIGSLMRVVMGRIPVLGICLGHQMLADYFGAKVEKGLCPMHGKLSKISHKGGSLWNGIPQNIVVTRYHSLVVKEETLPEELGVDAKSEDGAVMGISHKEYPIYGLQFHPEAVLTEYGQELIDNFKAICEEWKQEKGNQIWQ